MLGHRRKTQVTMQTGACIMRLDNIDARGKATNAKVLCSISKTV